MRSLNYLQENKIDFKILELKEIPRTAKDVERIYGCPLNHILKTLLFIGAKPVLVVLTGDKKVDLNKLSKVTNVKILRLAKPKEIEEITGCEIGSVGPFCLGREIIFVIDEKVFTAEKVNFGSGKPDIGIEMKSSDLRKIWRGIIADISE